jgi:hypothetical protein
MRPHQTGVRIDERLSIIRTQGKAVTSTEQVITRQFATSRRKVLQQLHAAARVEFAAEVGGGFEPSEVGCPTVE